MNHYRNETKLMYRAAVKDLCIFETVYSKVLYLQKIEVYKNNSKLAMFFAHATKVLCASLDLTTHVQVVV